MGDGGWLQTHLGTFGEILLFWDFLHIPAHNMCRLASECGWHYQSPSTIVIQLNTKIFYLLCFREVTRGEAKVCQSTKFSYVKDYCLHFFRSPLCRCGEWGWLEAKLEA